MKLRTRTVILYASGALAVSACALDASDPDLSNATEEALPDETEDDLPNETVAAGLPSPAERARLAGSSVAGASQVAAHVEALSSGCGNYCNDKDPTFQIRTGAGPFDWYTCADDAQTVSSTGTLKYGFTLQLRYSPRCRTVWARSYGTGNNGATFVFFLFNNAGYFPMREFTPSSGGNWSTMLDDADKCLAAALGETWDTRRIFGRTGCY